MQRVQRSWWWLWPSLTFVVTRLVLMLIPLGELVYPRGPYVMSDIDLYRQWAEILQTGQFPTGDDMWQYPPLVGPLLILGAHIPPGPTVGLMLLMLAFDAATFALLMLAARRTHTTAGAWLWVAAGIAVGPVWLTRFDVVPALFAVAALLSINRPLRAGAWMAVGALLKLWPALLLIAVSRRSFGRALIAFFAASAGLLLLLLATMNGAGSFASGQRSRGLQVESVPAWFFLVAHHLGWSRRYEYRYGAIEVIAPGTQLVATIVAVATVAGLLVVFALRLTGRLDCAAPADIALVVLLFSMVTSRVLSPQYLVWVAAVAAVCLLDPRTVMRPIVLVLAPIPVLGQILYPMRYEWLVSDGLTGLVMQSVRILALLVATFWAASRLLRADRVCDVRVDAVEHVREPS